MITIVYDQELYQRFCEAINERYEALLEFNAYAEEVRNGEAEKEYREDALLHAFSAFVEIYNSSEDFQELLETVPAEGIDSLEDLMIKTEKHGDQLQVSVWISREVPDETEMAAINAVSDNYIELEEYDLLC